MDKLQLEDTVSADRKERIIFDPEAWRKSDKSGRKTSAITSRQNFDNEKFTRKAKSDEEKVEESVIQPNDTSKVEAGGPEQSDTISKDKQKKSNSPQIEFVTGTATPNGSSSTAIGNAQNMGIKKISEQLAKQALDQMKESAGFAYNKTTGKVSNTQTKTEPVEKPAVKKPALNALNKIRARMNKEEVELSEDLDESKDTVVKDKDGHVVSWKHEGDWKKNDPKKNPEGKIHNLAGQALKKTKELTKEEIELEESRDDAYTRDYKSSISGMGKRQSAAYHADGGANDEGWDDEPSHRSSSSNTPHAVHINGKKWKTFGSHSHATNVAKKIKGATVHKEAFDPEQFGSDGSGAGGAGAGDIGKTDKKKKSVKLKQEETTMSKTYTEFMAELQESGYTVRKIEGTRYGGSKQTTHPEHDEDDEDSTPAEPVKRGRGRPAGSKSGANLKVTKGKSYGGIATHSLNLPNSNR